MGTKFVSPIATPRHQSPATNSNWLTNQSEKMSKWYFLWAPYLEFVMHFKDLQRSSIWKIRIL